MIGSVHVLRRPRAKGGETSGRQIGYQLSKPLRLKSKDVLLALLAALVALAALSIPASAGEGPAAQGETTQPAAPNTAPPRPQLLLIHGGSFMVDTAWFEPATRPRAITAGFEPHYLSYPLGDMPAALAAARAAAEELDERYGAENVYAYGCSAGGTLAALLSGEGLVQAAVAKAPPSDLVGWKWPLTKYGLDYFEAVQLDLAERYSLSPVRRPQERPLLIMQGRNDHVVPPAMSEAYAAKFKQVHLWLVPGGHTTEREHPYLISRAMDWLARVAAVQKTERRPFEAAIRS